MSQVVLLSKILRQRRGLIKPADRPATYAQLFAVFWLFSLLVQIQRTQSSYPSRWRLETTVFQFELNVGSRFLRINTNWQNEQHQFDVLKCLWQCAGLSL